MRWLLFVLAACTPPADASPTPSVKSLIWNLAPTGDRLGPKSISWLDDAGKTVWKKDIPKPLQFSVFDDGKTRDWLMKQRDDDGYAKYWAIALLPSAIAIGDEGELLVLDVKDGHTLFEQTPTADRGGDSFSRALFDSGDIEVTNKQQTCKLHVAQKQNFVLACGDALIAFDEGRLSVIDSKKWKLVKQIEWRGPSLDDLQGKCPGDLKKNFDETKQVGSWSIHAKGLRATVCMD